MGDIWEELQTSGKNLGLGQKLALLVFARQQRRDIAQIPVNRQLWIVPGNAALMRWRLVIRCFIEKFCGIAIHHKAMGKAWRHPQLALVVGAQFHRHPLTEGRGAFTDIHRHVEDFTRHATHQFALRMWRQLVVQATQNAF